MKNATCEFSRLPIRENEEIIVIPIRMKKNAIPNTQLKEVDDNWRILTMPFEAKYNGDGGIKEAIISDFDRKFWEKFEGPAVAKQAYDKRGYYVNVEKERLSAENSGSFEAFFNRMFCSKEMPNYAALMVHKELYHQILSNIAQRQNPEKDSTYKAYWTRRINRSLEEFGENVDKYFTNEEDVPESMRSYFKINTLSVLSHQMLHNFANKLMKFGHTLLVPEDTTMTYNFDEFKLKMQNNYRFHVCNAFLEDYLKGMTYDDELIARIAEVNMLVTALKLMNIGYMGTIHLHNSNEMKLQSIVAQFVTQQTQMYVRQQVTASMTNTKVRDDYIMEKVPFAPY